MKVVKIEWIDSCASNMNWTFMSELDGDVNPISIVTYGVVVKDNDECITVAQNYGTDPEQCCNLMTIPKGSIKKITHIEDYDSESSENQSQD